MTYTDLAKRMPQEVFTHHAQALGAEDLAAILMDYAATATIISPSGVMRGKDAIRQFFVDLLQALPKAQWRVKTMYADNVLFLEWIADSAQASVSDGVDTFFFEQGLITLQIVRNTIVPKAQCSETLERVGEKKTAYAAVNIVHRCICHCHPSLFLLY